MKNLFLILVVFTIGNFSLFASENSFFKAGAAISNITPSLGGYLVGEWVPTPAEHIHDDLHARCLVLDDGATQLLFVVVDNLGIPREVYDAAKNKIHQKLGIPVENMMMSATHTHTSVTARFSHILTVEDEFTEYQKLLISKIYDGAIRAYNNLAPAKIGWGAESEPRYTFNRRWHLNPETHAKHLRNPFGGVDKVRMNPGDVSPEDFIKSGPVDDQVSFLSIQTVAGKPISLLANYSTHYAPTGFKIPTISADYYGVFADRIEHLLGATQSEPPFVGIMSNGTSGDLTPINWENRKKWGPFEMTETVANGLAETVKKAHEKLSLQDHVKLDARQVELTLDIQKPTEEQIAYAGKMLLKADDAEYYHRWEKKYAKRVLALLDVPDQLTIVLQVFKVGDLAILSIPFETVAEIGLQLKKESPFAHTFTIAHANGAYGYLPTPNDHKLGGYETWLGTNFVEEEASTKIVNTLLGMLDELNSDKN